MKLKIGFIGVGAMGLSHVKSIHIGCAQHAEAVAICSRNEANIKKALEVAPNATVFKEESALINADLDAVFISTPNFLHVSLALQALAAGKHVFLEKPVGIHREECLRLLAASEKSDRVLMVGHELRYSAYFQKIKELVAAGEIGKPRDSGLGAASCVVRFKKNRMTGSRTSGNPAARWSIKTAITLI